MLDSSALNSPTGRSSSCQSIGSIHSSDYCTSDKITTNNDTASNEIDLVRTISGTAIAKSLEEWQKAHFKSNENRKEPSASSETQKTMKNAMNKPKSSPNDRRVINPIKAVHQNI
ncbi:hypothetical protein AB6A40_005790 [Gnathostoma spinigerum]|uniref:Uncharacterized protein n=1 Tax=Gnathostoma spinigerum TaxID=75299 RepID=A0ABD6EIJ9_9BILA